MVTWILATVNVIGLVLVAVMYEAQRRQLGSQEPAVDAFFPPVSVLKPLKGVDPALEQNLESFFHLDFPEYEILFGVNDPRDPAVAVARRVIARHPMVRARLVIAGELVGFNPKVNNLAGILPHARHELLLISDSNVAVDRCMLRHMVARMSDANVGLVTSFIRGVDGQGLGGALESLQLNTFVMGGVAAVSGPPGQVCAVGKSMLLRRADLERFGGFAELGRFLAEDQVCAEKIRELGREVVVCPHPIDNVLGQITVRGFASRHLRWARIRRHISLPGYLGELLTNPLAMAAGLLAVAPGAGSTALAVTTFVIVCATSVAAERRLGVRRSLIFYPMLVLIRAVAVAALWPVPLVSSSVSWRGRRFRITEGTRLVPDHAEEVGDVSGLQTEEAAA